MDCYPLHTIDNAPNNWNINNNKKQYDWINEVYFTYTRLTTVMNLVMHFSYKFGPFTKNQGRRKQKFCYVRDKNLRPFLKQFLKLLIRNPMGIAHVKSYMNKPQFHI